MAASSARVTRKGQSSTRVYAGAHRIVVQLRGYETAVRSVQVVAGETRPIDVELVPLPGTPQPARASSQPAAAPGSHHHRTRWGAWLTLGTGAVVASTGIVLIVADQDAPRDPDVTQPFDRRETMTLGIVSVGLGVAAIGAGSWWLRRDTGPPRGAAASAPAVLRRTRQPDAPLHRSLLRGGIAMRPVHLEAIAGILIFLLSVPAVADCPVVETHTGARPERADERLRPMFEVFAERGCLSGRVLTDALAGHSRAGFSVSGG